MSSMNSPFPWRINTFHSTAHSPICCASVSPKNVIKLNFKLRELWVTPIAGIDKLQTELLDMKPSVYPTLK